MISPRKFRRLPYSTQLRKSYRIVLDIQRNLRQAEQPAASAAALLRVAAEFAKDDPKAQETSTRLGALATAIESQEALANTVLEQLCERAAASLEALCGIAPADWDLLPPLTNAPNDSSPNGTLTLAPALPAHIAEITLYLESLRSPFNIGSISRTAAAFGCRQLYLSPGCADEHHPRSQRAAMGALEMLKITRASLSELRTIQPDATIVALETGGTPVEEFEFPRHGILVLGNEELGIDPTTLAAPDVHCVSIPCHGPKATLNVGVAAGIALSWWRTVS